MADDFAVTIIDQVINVTVIEEVINVQVVDEPIIVNVGEISSGGSDGSSNIILECEHSEILLEVNDLVYFDDTIENKIHKAIDNNSISPVIGVVFAILSPTSAQILIDGILRGANVFSLSKKLYVSPLGKMTTVLPEENYVQVIGSVIDNISIHFNPEITRIKRLEL
jgi:hypothetical protein